MSRITGSRASYGHCVQKLFDDCYRLFWTVDRKYAGSRLRHPTTISRDTDHAGAVRFAKKWKINPPA